MASIFNQERTVLSFAEFEKLRRLRAIFDDNYEITRIYSLYLSHFPELITKEMIDAIATDGISKEEAISAILAEAFLSEEDEAKKRRLTREYLRPSIRILDPERYYRDDYFKNVSIPDVKYRNWEFKTESYAPYQAVVAADLFVTDELREIPPLCYFEEEFRFPAVLEGGNEWMTLTPVDMDTSEEAIRAATGKVITFGLGLGYFTYHAANKPEVSSVTVIEKSPDVRELFEKYLLPQFPHKEKIRIIEADAFEYAEKEMDAEEYDFAFVDTWRDASDGYPMYLKMKKIEPKIHDTTFSYWIEEFLLSRHRSTTFEAIWEKESSAPTHAGTDAVGRFDDIVTALTKDALRKSASDGPLALS